MGAGECCANSRLGCCGRMVFSLRGGPEVGRGWIPLLECLKGFEGAQAYRNGNLQNDLNDQVETKAVGMERRMWVGIEAFGKQKLRV